MKLFKFRERDDDLVRLATFEHSMQAHSVRILLEASGIPATVAGEESNLTFGGFVGLGDAGLVGVQVYVRRQDLEIAKQVMSEVPLAADVLFPSWSCDCGAEVDEGFSVCWSCGNEIEEAVD
jgi:hypothetical protein